MPGFDDLLFDHFYIAWKIKETVKDIFVGGYRRAKWLLQKIFRKNHLSDIEVWGINYTMAPYILKRLEAFRKLNTVSYPIDFVSYEDDMGAWESKEQWEQSGAQGGGPEAWLAVIDEMIFAFHYFLADSSEKWMKSFTKKYGIDWHEKTPRNLTDLTMYKDKDGNMFYPSSNKKIDPSWSIVSSSQFYFDQGLYIECGQRAQKGFELFGKYYFSLAD